MSPKISYSLVGRGWIGMGKKPPTEDDIRKRAYLLWDRDGRPDGHSIDYWLQAARELEDEATSEQAGNPDKTEPQATSR